MLNSATTLMSPSLLLLKRRCVRKTLRRSALSPLSSKLIMKLLKNATHQWKKSAMDKEKKNAELSMNPPAPQGNKTQDFSP